jgi:Cys-tRNA(Pro) deacylase
MALSSTAIRALDRLGIPYHLFEHPIPPTSIEEAARERGQVPNQIIRSILFRYEKGHFFLALVAGPGQISWHMLRAYLGLSRISMASKEEVLTETGYSVGTVSPFGLPHPMRILADGRVFEPEEISIGCGVHGIAIVMKSVDLLRAVGKVEIGQFC